VSGLSDEQMERYARHLSLPEIGPEGQSKLLDATVAIVGLGGLGSPVSMYLAAAGIGTLGLIDGDKVELTNLQRQIVHDTPGIGRPKVESAADRLRGINPGIGFVLHDAELSAENALEVLEPYDIVIDCTDNFLARYVMNDAAQLLGKPFVHGAIFEFHGRAAVFMPGKGAPCYRCLFPEPPPPEAARARGGPFGVLPGIIGPIEATEAIKLILGIGEPLVGKMLSFDALEMEFTKLNVKWDPGCLVCGDNPTITEPIGTGESHGPNPLPSGRGDATAAGR